MNARTELNVDSVEWYAAKRITNELVRERALWRSSNVKSAK
jgi:hypothetical protein